MCMGLCSLLSITCALPMDSPRELGFISLGLPFSYCMLFPCSGTLVLPQCLCQFLFAIHCYSEHTFVSGTYTFELSGS
ncbi:hypothetical protein DL96DRAFT_1641827 [Flagelloscypha sp. PMI_526]|nr:hypothetical protein DL96DRAFT_1641827 [Flagelloscypha sp. PMI_526]